MKATTYTYSWIFSLSLVNHNLRMVCKCLRYYKVKLILTNRIIFDFLVWSLIFYPPIFLKGPNFDALIFVIFSPPVLKIEHVQWWIHQLFPFHLNPPFLLCPPASIQEVSHLNDFFCLYKVSSCQLSKNWTTADLSWSLNVNR